MKNRPPLKTKTGSFRHCLAWIMLILLGSSPFLAGCGQKGDLYRTQQATQDFIAIGNY